MSQVNNNAPIHVNTLDDLAKPNMALNRVLGNSTAHVTEGKIRLEGNTYTVKIVGSQVSASLSSRSLWSLFKPDRSVDISSRLTGAMGVRLSEQAKMYKATIDKTAMATQMANISTTGAGNHIATYGSKGPRADMQEVLRGIPPAPNQNPPHITTIDALNTAMGIKPDDLQGNKIYQTLSKIEATDFNQNTNTGLRFTAITSGNHAGEEDLQLCKNWVEFLQRPENFKKLDIFAKVHSFLNEPPPGQSSWGRLRHQLGKEEAAMAFVKKNIPSTKAANTAANPDQFHKLVQDVATCLMEYAELVNKLPEDQKQSAFITWAENKLNGITDTNAMNSMNTAIRTMSGIITTAAFRQTSKMGLTFFAEQKIPVAFAWKTHTGASLPTTPTSPGERPYQDKWWKVGADAAQVPAGRFEPITNSEMRQYERFHPGLSVVLIPGDR